MAFVVPYSVEISQSKSELSNDEKADKVNISNRLYYITENNFASLTKIKISFNCINKLSYLYDTTSGVGRKD